MKLLIHQHSVALCYISVLITLMFFDWRQHTLMFISGAVIKERFRSHGHMLHLLVL